MIDLFGKKAKENELRETNKKFLMYEIVIAYIGLTAFLALWCAALFAVESVAWMVSLLVIAFVIFIVACGFAIKIEAEAGFYECAKCGHRHVPKYSTVLFAAHVGRTRHMKCPECGEKSWQKKRLTEKDD